MKAKPFVIVALVALCSAQATFAQTSAGASSTASTSGDERRAEVMAELVIYKESGLAALERSDVVDFNSQAYQDASARFQRLRRSEHFAQLVHDIESGHKLPLPTARRDG